MQGLHGGRSTGQRVYAPVETTKINLARDMARRKEEMWRDEARVAAEGAAAKIVEPGPPVAPQLRRGQAPVRQND